MRKCIYLIFLWFMVLSCHNKTNNGEIVYIYPNGIVAKDNILYNPKYMNGKRFIHNDMKAYKIEEKDLSYISSCLKKGFTGKYKKLSTQKYFRQFIGYKRYEKIYVYINFFEYYISIRDGLHIFEPDIRVTFYSSKDGNYAFGHMILDYSSGEIIECEFKK